jgi:hypothetical protein
MSSFEEFLLGKKSKKQKKREVLEENVRKGRAAEDQLVWQALLFAMCQAENS